MMYKAGLRIKSRIGSFIDLDLDHLITHIQNPSEIVLFFTIYIYKIYHKVIISHIFLLLNNTDHFEQIEHLEYE